MKNLISILGSTGSIGLSSLEIINKRKSSFKINLLSANVNLKLICKQIIKYKPNYFIINDNIVFNKVKKKFKRKKTIILNNFDNLKSFKKNDITIAAIPGIAGLSPTIKMIKYSKKLLIANKEAIICGWNLIKTLASKNKTKIIPVDSEHFSIWSLTNKSFNTNLEKVFITASGGPFKDYPLKKFKSITKKQALKHPSWSMGKKISIDSATMMNKVFEIIEAKKIFNLSYSQLEILVHPKSYVHALVKFNNGLLKILVHDTDMTIPIFNSLYQSDEKKIKSKKIDVSLLNNLNFEYVNVKKFPIIKLIDILPDKESLFETIIVSANDCLVKNFLNNKLSFLDIYKILSKIIKKKEFQKYKSIKPRNIGQIRSLNDYVSLKIDTLCV